MRSIPGRERGTVNSIIMKARPFLKRSLSLLVRFLGIPNQHVWTIVDSNFLAISLNNTRWIVEEIICVNHGNADFALGQFALLAGERGPNLLLLDKEIEDAAELVITSLVGPEVVESSDLVEGWDGAAPVRWDAMTRVTNQEREVELLQDFCRNDGWIARLSNGIVRRRGLVMMPVCPIVTVGDPVGNTVGNTVGSSIGEIMSGNVRLPLCSNTFLSCLSSDRRGNGG
jgi:hypothetical protein